MSKITMKSIMYAVLIAIGAGQVFAAEEGRTKHNKSRFLSCFNCMRSAVDDVKEVAPVIHDLGTTTIEAAKVIATVNGNEKAVKNLDKAQDVLDEVLEVTQANDIHGVLDAGKDIVQIVDPKDTRQIINRIDKAEETIDVLKPVIGGLIESAVANADAKHT